MTWTDAEVTRVGSMTSETIDLGEMVASRHTIPAGFDSAPLYQGLPNDMCPCEHWVYVVRGSLRYRFADGGELDVSEGQAFHVRAGHLADVLEDSELVEFTPAGQHRRKADHLEPKQRHEG